MSLKVKWVSANRKATQPANPAYPKGIDIDASNGAPKTCSVKLPYPAPECGHHVVTCNKCKQTAAVTAAGRVDDPTSLKLACKLDVILAKAQKQGRQH